MQLLATIFAALLLASCVLATSGGNGNGNGGVYSANHHGHGHGNTGNSGQGDPTPVEGLLYILMFGTDNTVGDLYLNSSVIPAGAEIRTDNRNYGISPNFPYNLVVWFPSLSLLPATFEFTFTNPATNYGFSWTSTISPFFSSLGTGSLPGTNAMTPYLQQASFQECPVEDPNCIVYVDGSFYEAGLDLRRSVERTAEEYITRTTTRNEPARRV